MRLPVVPDISTKDGSANKNARLYNALKETRATGDIAQIRPGLVDAATSTGNGNGLVCYNGNLISVFDATLGAGLNAVTTDDLTPLLDTYSDTANAYGVSSDGYVVCGAYTHPATSLETGFLWYVDIDTLYPLSGMARAFSVSDDGLVVVGLSALSSYKATRWSLADGYVDLGTLGGSDSVAYGVSGDGTTVVGWAHNSGAEQRAFRWTSAGGMQDLVAGIANACSSDGSVVVGENYTSGYRAFRWNAVDGVVDIGTLGGSIAVAADCSSDGLFIVGHSTTSGADTHPFLYTVGGSMVDLGLPTGFSAAYATGVSDDGGVVVGWGIKSGQPRGFKWTTADGFTEFQPIAGTQLKIHDISTDGFTFVGMSTYSATGVAFYSVHNTAYVPGSVGTISAGKYDFVQSPL